MSALPVLAANPAARPRQPGKRRAMITGIVVFSIAAHVAALVVFGLWVVSKYFKEPEAVFEMKPDLRIPPEPPEHRLNMARHEAMAPKPVMKKRLVSTRPSAIALPPLPVVDVEQALAFSPNALAGLNSASLAGTAAGFGSAAGPDGWRRHRLGHEFLRDPRQRPKCRHHD